jgi:serine/threonine-protein kinase RsbW
MEPLLDHDAVTVSVPARAEFVHVVRAVTASVASRLRIPYDAIEDLRLAVDEAAARLLAIRAPMTRLLVRLTPAPDRLEVVVSVDAPISDWPTPDLEGTLAWTVLVALVDAVRPQMDRSGPSIRLVKRTLEATPAR